ncbi:Seryl-tRNA synthetase [Candidatus Johnevansia muelleri]|uniref:Serine--tRNA ligase n=1 Tax=Candidatus Johnevansia muelleri TaxID=1495769 RepID=A0A078KHB4_9GAMM|nr:Seryl-tRNA synthetase [Candidatus Evansia muelleri]
MLDNKLLRSNLDNVAAILFTKRGFSLDIKRLRQIEALRKKLYAYIEELNINKSKNLKYIKIYILKIINKRIKFLNKKLNDLNNEFNEIVIYFPNIPHNTVPIGKNKIDNVEIIRVGIPRVFNFKLRNHIDIGNLNGKLDFKIASKITGSRFVILRNNLAKLHRALTQFMLDKQTMDHGYEEIYVPYIVNSNSLIGTGQLPKFGNDLFAIDNDQGYYLIPTAEVPLINIVRNKIIENTNLPIKLTAHTPCFRREAGSYGNNIRGLIRQHQFDKIEIVQIVEPENSYNALEEMRIHAEVILKLLELPYRVVILCTNDMSFSAAKTYDLEVWIPSQNQYYEVSSISNCEAFQARRIKARLIRKNRKNPVFVHTLNGSGIAVGRCLVAIMENYQNEDGSITIPNILRKYMNNIDRIN